MKTNKSNENVIWVAMDKDGKNYICDYAPDDSFDKYIRFDLYEQILNDYMDLWRKSEENKLSNITQELHTEETAALRHKADQEC